NGEKKEGWREYKITPCLLLHMQIFTSVLRATSLTNHSLVAEVTNSSSPCPACFRCVPAPTHMLQILLIISSACHQVQLEKSNDPFVQVRFDQAEKQDQNCTSLQ
ncbi:hypothetical protein AMECASPLE_026085, partial [Ameca splendens]